MLLAALGVVLLCAGCSAVSKLRSTQGTKYRYTYELSAPVRSPRLAFQDERVGLLFRIDQAAIRFKLTNRSPEPIRIKWDEATLVVRGRSYAVRNRRTLYVTPAVDYANPTILPGGYIIDMALPADNISFDGRRWVERDLLPTVDRNSEAAGRKILANMGNTISFLLPVENGQSLHQYRFEFKVSKVDTLAWERYRRPARPAPPPPLAKEKAVNGTSSTWTTAIIVGGVVGLAAVLLLQKKTPPAE